MSFKRIVVIIKSKNNSMKNAIMIFCFLGFANLTNGQDTIFKSNNDIVIAKISEITATEIKYKRYDFQNGPAYIELKSNVKMIIYANGVKEIIRAEPASQTQIINGNDDYVSAVDRNLKIEILGNKYLYKGTRHSEKQIQQLLLDTKDRKIAGYVIQAKRAQKLQYVGFGAIPLGIIGLVAIENAITPSYTVNGQYSTKTNYNMVALGAFCIAGSITCPIVSGVFKYKRKKYNSEAIHLYNEKY